MYSRKSLLAQIHMARKALGMHEDVYRGMLLERYDVASSAKLPMPRLLDLVRHFEALGWVPARKPAPRKEIHPLCRKIWAQCYSLQRPVPEYADGLAKHMHGVEKLVWCDPMQLRAITSALAKQQAREGAKTA